MMPLALDHVALYVADRDQLASELCELLDVHVVDRTDRYTLVGASATSGKLTLFDPPGNANPEPENLVSVLLADETSRPPLHTSAGLTLEFESHGARPVSAHRHAVIGVTLRTSEPAAVAKAYRDQYGFEARSTSAGGAVVGIANSTITFEPGPLESVAQPMLNHLGVLVSSAQHHIDAATRDGLRIRDVVDAPNTLAVFIDGPDGVSIEYVEHKPEFALT